MIYSEAVKRELRLPRQNIPLINSIRNQMKINAGKWFHYYITRFKTKEQEH